MKTAVEWYAEEFAEHLEETYGIKITSLTLLHKAKEMEKEQIVNAHYQGYRPSIGTTEISEQYYNETFKQQEQ